MRPTPTDMWPSRKFALQVVPDVGYLSAKYELVLFSVFELMVGMGQTDGQTNGWAATCKQPPRGGSHTNENGASL